MKRYEQTKQKPPILANHPGTSRLLGGVVVFLLLLLATAMFFAPRFVASPSIKQKIQAAVTEKTGTRLDYQAIELSYFPRPGIELQGLSLVLPEQIQGTIASLRVSPRLLPLLTGDVHLSSLEFDTPKLSLALPDAKPDATPSQPWTLATLKENLTRASEAGGAMLSGLKITVSNAQLTMTRSKKKLVNMAGLSLQGGITVNGLNTAQTTLETKIDELSIYRRDHAETIRDINLSGSVQMSPDEITATLDQLHLGEPGLALTGELVFTPSKPNLTLHLSGNSIDVAACRTTVLALAGDTTPIKEIFDYLRGGQVDQISLTSHGENLAELGKLDNILIKGRLHNGRVSIPKIKLELTEMVGDVLISKGILQGTGLSTRLKNSTGHDGSLQIGLTEQSDLFKLELTLNADLAEVYSWLVTLEGLHDQQQKVQQISGRVDMSALKLQGMLNKPSAWKITSTGTLKNLVIKTELFPDTINLTSGEFTMNPQQLSFKKLKIGTQDAALTLSGSIKGLPKQLDHLNLSLDGRMGAQSFKWLSTQFKLPDIYTIHTPFNINDTSISWQRDSTTSFKGLVAIDNGPTIATDVDFSPGQLKLHQLTVKDRHSDAVIIFDRKNDQRDFKFTGRLQHETLQTLFVNTAFSSGRLEGNLAVSVPPSGQTAVTVKGQLTGDNLPLVLPSGELVDIDHIMLQGDGYQIKVDIDRLTWEDQTWAPVNATVSFNNDSAEIRFVEARLCGIDSPGTISATGDTFSVDMVLTGKNLDVATSYSCLTRGEVKMTGSLDFSSKITTTGQMDRLVKRMQGPLQMTFSNGVIQQDKMLSRILEVLNVTEIIKGRLPNLTSKGFPYKTMTLQGQFQNGKLTIDKYHMDGETLDLLGKGEINLEERTIDMQLLAAPLQTVNTIVKNVPGVNYLLAGSLVSIPVTINGPLTNPKVTVLSVSAVSSSLLNLGKRTIKAPVKLLDALNPWSKKK